MAVALIVAGGKGLRMGQSRAKQYLMLAGRPIIAHTLAAMAACRLIERIYLVIPPDDISFCRQAILPPLALPLPICLVAGGAERQGSVYNGLKAVGRFAGIVVIHDGVRPLVTPDLIANCIMEAHIHGACIVGIPATDTLKQIASPGVITATLARSGVWLAQTPQAFNFDLIFKVHQHAAQSGRVATDDAMLLEQCGQTVRIIQGSRINLKITTPEDLELAKALLWKVRSKE